MTLFCETLYSISSYMKICINGNFFDFMEAKKILFACIPADGHFNPMTGIAMELIDRGHDVRWYTSKIFEEKLNRLGILHYPFKKALEANQFNVDELPMVAAGVNEGKNEICARIGFFKLGVNLLTEKPSHQKIKMAVDEILANLRYKKNIEKLKDEFKMYDANKLSADYILSTIKK